ncbi:MAG: hypothetical protein KTV68_09775 [Acidimicrobiia bacterium]|nr:hypothetical protein [Acidimicrobiia bacterium]
MNPSASVEPSNGDELFTVTTNGHIHVAVSPFRFYLPERAKRATPNLHIVIDGWIDFDGTNDLLRTTHFGTRVAYVRARQSRFEHVYGTHYDQSKDDLGHPVFHAQIKSMKDLATGIPGCESDAFVDKVVPILSNVRTPTPQMDIFSAVEQVCADHLLWEGSEDKVRSAYKELRNLCAFFKGSGHLMDRFAPDMADCCRSTHWYKPWVPIEHR